MTDYQTPEEMGLQTYPEPEENPFLAARKRREQESYSAPAATGMQTYQPPAPLPELTASERENPFIVANRKRQEAGELGENDLSTRANLNMKAAFYGGTLLGSSYFAALKRDSEDPENDPADREKAREGFLSARDDLIRHELMRGWDGPLEGTVALGGQLFGGSLSPESMITRVPGAGRLVAGLGSTVAKRISEAAITQGAVNAATDPVVQALSIQSGAQKEFSGSRVAIAAGLGAVLGGGLQGAGEAIGKLAGKTAAGADYKSAPSTKQERISPPTDAQIAVHLAAEARRANEARLDAAVDDPSLLAAGEQAKPALTQEQHYVKYIAGRGVAKERNFQVRVDQAAQEVKVKAALEEAGIPVTKEDATFVTRAAQFVEDGTAQDPLIAYDLAVNEELRQADHLNAIGANDIQFSKKPKGETKPIWVEDSSGNRKQVPADTPHFWEEDYSGKMVRMLAETPEESEARSKAAVAAIEKDPTKSILYSKALSAQREYKPDDTSSLPEIEVVFTEDVKPVHETPEEIATKEARGKELKSILLGTQRKPKSDDDIQFSKKKPGDPAQPALPVPDAAPNAKQVLSLQEQGARLAEAIDRPLRQGRVQGGKDALGQASQGVARVKNVADVDTIVHEAGHLIEQKVGKSLSNLINRHAHELNPLDYDTVRASSKEGFAVFTAKYVTAPGVAARDAPEFTKAFEAQLAKDHPDILAALLDARQAYTDYKNAPTGNKIAAMMKSSRPDSTLTQLKKDGLASSITNFIRGFYRTMLDDKAPITIGVKQLTRMIRDESGELVDLKSSVNPDHLIRLINSAHQAASSGQLYGIIPRGKISPEGPSLRGAIEHAIGAAKWFGKWDQKRVDEFANYLILRRAEYLYRKWEPDMDHKRPIAMSREEVITGLAEFDAANPTFRAASEMVHGYSRQLLRKTFEGGLRTREEYDLLLQEEFYVPLFRDMTDKPMAGSPGGGGSNVPGPGGVRLTHHQVGSDRDPISPIEGMMMQSFLVERTLAHNDTVNSLAELGRLAREAGATNVGSIIEDIPVNDLIGKDFDITKGIKAAAAKYGMDELDTKVLLGSLNDAFGDDPILARIFHQEPTKPNGEPIMFHKVGGVLKAVRLVSGKEGLGLYEAVSTMSAPMRKKWEDISIGIGQSVATSFRYGVTTSLPYGFKNFTRDQLVATFLVRGFIPFYHGIMGARHELKQTDMAKLYAHSGGISPGAAVYQIDDIIEKDPTALAREGWAAHRAGAAYDLVTKGDIKGAFNALASTIGIAETGTRVAVFEIAFKNAKKHGLNDYDSMREAAWTAKDLMDFGRHGSMTEVIRRILPFFGSWTVSMEKFYRAAVAAPLRGVADVIAPLATKDAPIHKLTSTTKQERQESINSGVALGKLGLAGLLGYTYYKIVQDSNNDQVRNLRPEVRAKNFPIPGEWYGSPGTFLALPKPFEWAAIWNLGEMIAQAEEGDERANEFFWEGLWDILSPPFLMPTVYKVSAELKSNYNFFTEREIVPDDIKQRMSREAEASSLAKTISKAIGVSPLKVDHAVGSLFGTMGRDIMAASSAADKDAPDAGLAKTPGLMGFFKPAYGGYSQTGDEFWKLMNAKNGTYAEAKAIYDDKVDNGDEKGALAFAGALPENQRVYTMLQSEGTETGKPKYKPEEKRLHPLVRAADAFQAIKGYRRELEENKQKDIATQEPVIMNSSTRHQVIEALDKLKLTEQQNAFIVIGERGYQGRKINSVTDQFEVLRTIPNGGAQAAAELARRYAQEKVLPFEQVSKVWPSVKKSVLQGDVYEVRGLGADARGDGYEFGAIRHKKAPKPRIPMANQLEASP